MEPIIIENASAIRKKLRILTLNSKRDTVVFDIHRTTLYQNHNNQTRPDMEVLIYITYLIQHYNVLFLSFDGSESRIMTNNKALNGVDKLYKTIPRIFIKKRKKDIVLLELARMYRGTKIIMVDDNKHNIDDIDAHQHPLIQTYYYTKNTKYHHHNSLNKLLDLLK
jgi:hypothetical protein